MKRKIIFILVMLLIAAFLIVTCVYLEKAAAENEFDGTILYVKASQLNGRYSPRKTGIIEVCFDQGTEVTATGKWSDDMLWIEVYGGECGTVWCKAEYLSEILEPVVARNIIDGKVKIRSKPGKSGKVRGYVNSGCDIVVTQIVLGWGKTNKGWIDLTFFDEIAE